MSCVNETSGKTYTIFVKNYASFQRDSTDFARLCDAVARFPTDFVGQASKQNQTTTLLKSFTEEPESEEHLVQLCILSDKSSLAK